MSGPSIVLAYAGRRIDAQVTTPPRFPEQAVERVERELEEVFDRHEVAAVVGSAACGADILVLEAAARRGIRARVVLPFDAQRFRKTSVVDRGGAWGARYDVLIARNEGELVTLPGGEDSGDDPYARATRRIIEEAVQLGRELAHPVVALVLWDAQPRPAGDATRDFLDLAQREQLQCLEITTIGSD